MKPAFHLPYRSFLLAAAASAAAALPFLGQWFEYQREAILGGEIWRLFTAHLVHAGGTHLLWDGIPLVVLGFLFEAYLGRRFWTVLAISCLAVGGGLLLVESGLDTYRGLSGILNGIWVAGALAGAAAEKQAGRRGLSRLYLFCVILDLGKIWFETVTGHPIFTDSANLGGTAIPWSHALGAAGGFVAYGWSVLRQWEFRGKKSAVGLLTTP